MVQKCHCERSEAIPLAPGDCFVASLLAMTKQCYISTLNEYTQNDHHYKILQGTAYDFWENRIITSSDIGILPSLGVSFEIDTPFGLKCNISVPMPSAWADGIGGSLL
ncbi:MAG TPA: hypothetical protein VGD14_17310 [bacterium]